MSDYRFDNRSRGRRDSRRPELHDAVCDECGNDCKVPFRPSGDKPIYCSDCFEKKGGRDGGRPSRGGGRRSFGDRGPSRSSGGGASDQSITKLTESIKTLNIKLDKVISLLPSDSKKKEKPVKAKAKSKAKPKAKPKSK